MELTPDELRDLRDLKWHRPCYVILRNGRVWEAIRAGRPRNTVSALNLRGLRVLIRLRFIWQREQRTATGSALCQRHLQLVPDRS